MASALLPFLLLVLLRVVVIAGASVQTMRQLGGNSNSRAAYDSVISRPTAHQSDANLKTNEQEWQRELHELWLQAQKQRQMHPNSTTEHNNIGQNNRDGEDEEVHEAQADDPGISLNLWFYHGAAHPGGQRSVVTYVPPHSAAHAPSAGKTAKAGFQQGQLPSLF